ncbi:hypothetical protein [Klebsiella quasivariicola]|uniref:hypothetical protein n=1 Tax=Klebsiella quasivariicola TaxID=2026240 RepID=UPI001CCDCAA6|nr:hypothetical protein [Klebsiella quasivariicola]MBZ9583437.1 hypothetical protein [Klebsiella quasivariicola]
MKPKIYTATPDDLSPPVQSESFCVDVVLAADYHELEEKCQQLAAENVQARERHRFIRALAISILEHSGGRHDWRGAMEDASDLVKTVDEVYSNTPTTDRIVAGIKADEEKAVLNDLLRHLDKIDIENLSSPWELSSEVVAFANSRLLREGADK